MFAATAQLIREIIELESEIYQGTCMSCQIVVSTLSRRKLHVSVHVNISSMGNATCIKSDSFALKRN